MGGGVVMNEGSRQVCGQTIEMVAPGCFQSIPPLPGRVKPGQGQDSREKTPHHLAGTSYHATGWLWIESWRILTNSNTIEKSLGL